MAAPKVQSIEQLVKTLNPAYKDSINVIAQRQAQLPGKFTAQRSALEAAKTQGFNLINNNTTARGVSFGGISADEQADYLSTKFLPGMQQLTQQENEEGLALTEALASINQERRLKAIDMRTGQQDVLQRYLSEQRQLKWDKEKFAQQMALDRARLSASTAKANSGMDIQIKKQKGGGYDVYVDGKKGVMDLATAAKAQGLSVLSLLSNGSASDKAAYQKYLKTNNKEALRSGTGAFYLGGKF